MVERAVKGDPFFHCPGAKVLLGEIFLREGSILRTLMQVGNCVVAKGDEVRIIKDILFGLVFLGWIIQAIDSMVV